MDDITGERLDFEEAINKTGFGKYNICLLIACCLLILAMYIDIFGFSIVLPDVACDMGLSTTQQGLLSAIPLIVVALPILQLTFSISMPLINLNYRPWRLLLQLITFPGIFGTIGIMLVRESPKFLLSKDHEKDAIDVLKTIHKWNKGSSEFKISSVHLKETITTYSGNSVWKKIWNQTAPLFKPPLLKNSLILYYMLLCAYMTSTGYTMWVPTMTNAYFNGEDNNGKTFCEVASKAASQNNLTTDCSTTIQPMTLYAVMCYSGMSGTLNILLTFIVGPLGKKRTTLLVFIIAIVAGVLLLFVKPSIASIGLFFIFLYVALILGNVNTYLVELNPTQLRGMATCLSVVVARGFGFFSVQLIATLLSDHCRPMIGGYIALITSGLLIAIWLPADNSPGGNRYSR
ncbi:uncharacterized protein LOC125049482 isoform X2 [Pieris napi]|uniref:uncharacterized protein LOC125049482 isoform X2 n=1 Tax=Pieris napi TaxID=78633 RepID=UPI001FBA4B11|nr:uncharacterized protein LOC125049482 isoform X2 [Pieris napi]